MATKMKFDVLAPVYHEAGRNVKGEMTFYVTWKKVGKANSMDHATDKFGHNVALVTA